MIQEKITDFDPAEYLATARFDTIMKVLHALGVKLTVHA